jgi:hypothetical protein
MKPLSNHKDEVEQ